MRESAGEIHLLHVADEASAAEFAERVESEREQLTVHTASTAGEARDRLASGEYDCVVAEYELPDSDGVAFLEAVRADEPTLPFVLFTADGDERVASEAIAAGVTDYVPKTGEPEQYRELTDRIVDAVEQTSDERHRELKRIQSRFEGLTEHAALAVVTIDDESTVRYASDAVEDVLGYAPSELEGESLYRVMPEEYHDPHKEAVERYLREGTKHVDWHWTELPGRHRDGHEVPLGISFGETTIEGEHRFTAILRDITERKERERERRATIELLRNLYDVTTDGELAFDEKMSVLLELGCEWLGLSYGFLSRIETPEDDETSRVQNIVHAEGDHELLQPGESCPLSRAYCRKTIRTDGLLAVDDAIAEGWTEDPAYREFELGCYIGGKVVVNGELYGTLCFAATDARSDPFTDAERTLVRLMSRWVSYELERMENQRELKRQNDRLDQFASVVSHDLRNPLNVARLHLENVAQEYPPEDIEAIDDALARMNDIIEDALLLARQGGTVEETEPVSLSSLAERSWGNCVTDGCELVVEDDCRFEADPDQAGRLLENLFRNAIEHNDDGVTITLGALEDGFYVADDGTGIPDAECDDVFTSGYSTSEDGTGLGLTIVDEIAQAHDWTVDLVEDVTDGARFEFRGVSTRP